ncbi:MAG: disulfide bond formation protein DsbA [Leptothrix sp. (in: Bacteria)]|nr:disulfide bond formation protein DsbA [Leptothrix sp. (in: b-proteobacteria)]
MSRKTHKSVSPSPQAAAPPSAVAAGGVTRRRGFVVATGVGVLALGGAGAYLAFGGRGDAQARPGLASEHAPSLGPASARVHVVEFLDPACETCAVFYPLVKRWMAEHGDKLRLSVRHVPLHRGSEEVVRMLEASRRQDRYWPTLETLLASQGAWVHNHVVQPAQAMQVLSGAGLDIDRLRADMHTPEIEQRMAQDSRDAALLQVSKTPEYFVNGRQMASFGRQQLQALIQDAVKRAY